MALEENHLGIARQLLEHYGTPDLECQANGLFFATAISKGNIDMLRLLLEFGCSVTYPNCLGKTPLQLAARTCHEDITKPLLEHGSDINYAGYSWAPLNAAVHAAVHRIHDPKVVELLVSMGADVNSQTMSAGNTALHTIADSTVYPWSARLIELLFEHGANLQIVNRAGETALNVAARQSSRAMHVILLDAWLRQRNAGQEYARRYREVCEAN
jgi:ankyrin repeat protein